MHGTGHTHMQTRINMVGTAHGRHTHRQPFCVSLGVGKVKGASVWAGSKGNKQGTPTSKAPKMGPGESLCTSNGTSWMGVPPLHQATPRMLSSLFLFLYLP